MGKVVSAERERDEQEDDYVPNANMNVNAVNEADRERLVCRQISRP
jgi:hypothetical protein